MKIYKVFYKVGGTAKEIGKGRNLKKAHRVIYRFLEKNHYKAPYWRSWCDDYGCLFVDVGAWFETFNIKEEVI